MKKRILVTGITGNIGSHLVPYLQKHDCSLVGISRDAQKTAALETQGIAVHAGDLTNADFVTRAFAGVDVAFLMLPPNYTSANLREAQGVITANYVRAIQTHGIKKVVCLSSVGAHLSEGAGIIAPLYDLEQKIRQLPVDAVFLRPSYFMENLFTQISVVKAHRIMAASIKEDLKMGFVAVKDIAMVAAKYLTEDFLGQKVQFVLGPEDLTYSEVATAIGQKIGIPDLPYVKLSSEEFTQASIAMGMAPAVVHALSEYIESSNTGAVGAETVRDAVATTPTSIHEFAEVFAQVYNHSN